MIRGERQALQLQQREGKQEMLKPRYKEMLLAQCAQKQMWSWYFDSTFTFSRPGIAS